MTKNGHYSQFPDIEKYAKSENLSEETLVAAYKLEAKYHKLLVEETNPEKRKYLYDEFYSTLLPLYGRLAQDSKAPNPKEKYVKLFAPEITNASIVDFGCGEGLMLKSINERLPTKSLTGIDVFIPENLKSHPKIGFLEANIVEYEPDQKFDIAFSDNVLEHLVPEDAKTHLSNIYKSLNTSGKLIIIMPNRNFSPWDITRIKDFTQSGKTAAQGGHVNESTHKEMTDVLRGIGFQEFQTIIPFPKLKYSLFKNIRINARWIEFIERSSILMRIIKFVTYKGECILKFPVLIIAKK